MVWAAALTAEVCGSPSRPATLVSACAHICCLQSPYLRQRNRIIHPSTIKHSPADRVAYERGSMSQAKQRGGNCSMLRNCEQLMSDSPS